MNPKILVKLLLKHYNHSRFFKRTFKLSNYLTNKDHVQLNSSLLNTKIISNKNEVVDSQETYLSLALKNGKVPSVTEWATLKTNVLNLGRRITDLNFDAKAIICCAKYENYEAAKTLLQLYKSKNENLNIAALGKFFNLFYACNQNKESIDPKEEKFILNIYNEMKRQHPVFSTITIDNVIPALSLTNNWNECKSLLEAFKFMDRPPGNIYNAIIKAAFKNKEIDYGWKLIDEMSSINKFPYPMVYNEWLKYANKKTKVVNHVEHLLSYFANYDIIPSKDVTDNILKVLKPLSFVGQYTTINNYGACQACKRHIAKVSINKDEFAQLRNVFMDNVIVGKNIFTKTEPVELERFKSALKNKCFDVVIDGLNVAYSAGNQKTPEFYARTLANVVKYYKTRSYRILLIGRNHMHKWPKNIMNYIHSNSDLFFTQNISEDDPFLLYAAMSSGLGTSFLSRDHMRSHLYLLMDIKSKKLFRRWQQLHQHSLIRVEHNGPVHIKFPFPFLCSTQVTEDRWHIPFREEHVVQPPLIFEPHKTWLCIHRKEQ